MTLSGTAWASAFITAFQARKLASILARTGAGWCGLRRQPFGAVTVIGLPAPAGEVSTPFTQDRAAETVAAKGAFRFRRTWGDVPVKSIAIESPATVTVAFTGSGASVMPSSSTASSPR